MVSLVYWVRRSLNSMVSGTLLLCHKIRIKSLGCINRSVYREMRVALLSPLLVFPEMLDSPAVNHWLRLNRRCHVSRIERLCKFVVLGSVRRFWPQSSKLSFWRLLCFVFYIVIHSRAQFKSFHFYYCQTRRQFHLLTRDGKCGEMKTNTFRPWVSNDLLWCQFYAEVHLSEQMPDKLFWNLFSLDRSVYQAIDFWINFLVFPDNSDDSTEFRSRIIFEKKRLTLYLEFCIVMRFCLLSSFCLPLNTFTSTFSSHSITCLCDHWLFPWLIDVELISCLKQCKGSWIREYSFSVEVDRTL